MELGWTCCTNLVQSISPAVLYATVSLLVHLALQELAVLDTSAHLHPICLFKLFMCSQRCQLSESCMTQQQRLSRRWRLAAVLVQAIAFIVAIMAVCYSVVTTCVESRALDLEASLPEDESELLPYRPEFFHAVFGLASAYLCMLYISWNLNTLPSRSGDGKFQVGCCTLSWHGLCCHTSISVVVACVMHAGSMLLARMASQHHSCLWCLFTLWALLGMQSFLEAVSWCCHGLSSTTVHAL